MYTFTTYFYEHRTDQGGYSTNLLVETDEEAMEYLMEQKVGRIVKEVTTCVTTVLYDFNDQEKV